jgi:aspartate racemase
VRTIGLIGGMSWESSLHYYRLVNEGISRRLGGLHSAQVVMWSVDFAPIERMQAAGRWAEAGAVVAAAGAGLERAGADFLVLCTNTMHRVAERVEAATSIPLLHIADATAAEVQRRGLRRIGLLGTRFTMEEEFYRARLETRYGLDVRTPPAADREIVHRVIYDELCLGKVTEGARDQYRRIAADLVESGAEGVIFGCTEIMMLLGPADVAAPTFDTTAIHAAAAVERALAG